MIPFICLSIALIHKSIAPLGRVQSAQGTNSTSLLTVDNSDYGRAKACEKELIEAFKAVDAPVLVDLPYAINTVHGLHVTNDRNCLERVAEIWGQHLAEVRGAYVVHRVISSKFLTMGVGSGAYYLWLDKLHSNDPATFAALVQGGVSFGDLDDDGKKLVAPFVGGSDGSAEAAAEDHPLIVSLGFSPNVVSTDSTGRQRYVPQARPQPGRSAFNSPKTRSSRIAHQGVAPFVPAKDGDLDFGSGKVMKLLDLVNVAGKALHFGGSVDDRLLYSPVFVKGRYTQKRMIDSLRLIGTIPVLSLQIRPSDKDLDSVKRSVLQELLKNFPGLDQSEQDFLDSLIQTGRQAADPDTLKRLGLGDLKPEASWSVSLGLSLEIEGSVTTTDDKGQVKSEPFTGQIGLPGR